MWVIAQVDLRRAQLLNSFAFHYHRHGKVAKVRDSGYGLEGVRGERRLAPLPQWAVGADTHVSHGGPTDSMYGAGKARQ